MGWHGTAIRRTMAALASAIWNCCVVGGGTGPGAGARCRFPRPFISSPRRSSPPARKSRSRKYLPKIASGEFIGTFARAEGPGAVTPKSIRTTFKGGKLTGKKIAVVDGMDADAASCSCAPAMSRVSAGCRSPSSISRACRSARRLHRSLAQACGVQLADTPAEALGKTGEGWSTTSSVLDRAAIMTSFEQVGGADVCLAMAKDYAMQRYAFGRLIGSYQAIKHKLAGHLCEQRARPLQLPITAPGRSPLARAKSRWRRLPRASPPRRRLTSRRKENTQTHGGIGFTWKSIATSSTSARVSWG